jgi:hypothetical protein
MFDVVSTWHEEMISYHESMTHYKYDHTTTIEKDYNNKKHKMVNKKILQCKIGSNIM